MIKECNLKVIGMGYVGLTLAAVYAKAGFKVTGIDCNDDVVSTLNQGKPHFYEKGLSEMMSEVSDNLSFTNVIQAEKHSNSIFVIAVGTSLKSDGSLDFEQLDSAVADIAKVIKKEDMVILRSTVLAGVTRNHVIPELEKMTGLRAGDDICVGFAPERTVEGRALEELVTLPQIISGVSKNDTEKLNTFFSYVCKTVIVADSLESAELSKLISNTYRDMSFAFANSVALVARKHNVDTKKLIHQANHGYNRNQIPLPSAGVGGYCLTKDPYLFAHSNVEDNRVYNLVQASRSVNESMPSVVVETVADYCRLLEYEKNVSIGVIGLAFKDNPENSDVRFSPSIDVIQRLQKEGYSDIRAYDPLVDDSVYLKHNIKYECLDDLLKNQVLIFMHGSKRYQKSDIVNKITSDEEEKLLMDTWGIFTEEINDNQSNMAYATLSFNNFKRYEK